MNEPFAPASAFTVAEAMRAGMTRDDIDSLVFERPFRGLRSIVADSEDEDVHPAAAEREAIVRRAQQYAAHLHAQEFFSHTTAAILWRMPLPLLRSTDVHVSVPAPHRAPRGVGVVGHQLSPRTLAIVRHPELSLPLTSPAATWALLGGALRNPYDLVAAGDAAVSPDRLPGPGSRILAPPLTTPAQLIAAIPSGRRGVRALREATQRVRVGAASRMETWMRLTLVDAGLPEPELDFDVYSDDGRFLGCVDGAYPALRVALEYEGDHHRTDAAAWQRDVIKHDDLARAGWRVIRITRAQLRGAPRELCARVRDALRVATPHRRFIDLP